MSRARQCETHGYPLMVNGDMLPATHLIQGRVAFWKGVKIEE